MCALMLGFALIVPVAAGPSPLSPTQPDQPMTPTITTKDHDKAVLDTLKDVHNRGAELYNAGDHVGAFRIYQGGLIVAKPFLAHRSKQQEAIREGLEQIEKSNADPKLKAFRLHEVIEQIRGDLKDELKKQAERDRPGEAAVTGTVALLGKPFGNVLVSFVPTAAKKALATVKGNAEGSFHVATTLPAGSYLVTLAGEGVPDAYSKVETTPLKAELKAGVNTLTFDAK